LVTFLFFITKVKVVVMVMVVVMVVVVLIIVSGLITTYSTNVQI